MIEQQPKLFQAARRSQLAAICLGFECSPVHQSKKKKNWFKEGFPTDAKSMKLLPSGPPHFLLWLPDLSFFYYKRQQCQESFLPEAISMLHHCRSPEQKGINFTNIQLDPGPFPRASHQLSCKRRAEPPLCTIRFRKCSCLEAGLLSLPGQCLAPCPQVPMAH